MGKVVITIETLNSAFDEGNPGYELARILRGLADKFENEEIPKTIMDINGNKVGEVVIE